MFFESPEICPFLEATHLYKGLNPHCVMIYNDLTLWTIEELCCKSFTDCPTYKEANKKRPAK